MEGQLKIVGNPLGLFFLTIEELYRKSAKCLNRSGKRTEFGESFGASCRCLLTAEIEAKQFQILRFSNYRIIRKDAPGSQLKEIYDIFVQQTIKRGGGWKGKLNAHLSRYKLALAVFWLIDVRLFDTPSEAKQRRRR